ncbi:MAG: hypothetical protein V2A34_06535, partial [Lentisphaerota bacterium]
MHNQTGGEKEKKVKKNAPSGLLPYGRVAARRFEHFLSGFLTPIKSPVGCFTISAQTDRSFKSMKCYFRGGDR